MDRLAASLFLSLLVATPALAQEAPSRFPDGSYWMHGWHGGWGMTLFGPLFMIFFIGSIVALTIWLVRGAGGYSPPHHRGRDPIDILKDRFARGEIDKDEYEERRKILER